MLLPVDAADLGVLGMFGVLSILGVFTGVLDGVFRTKDLEGVLVGVLHGVLHGVFTGVFGMRAVGVFTGEKHNVLDLNGVFTGVVGVKGVDILLVIFVRVILMLLCFVLSLHFVDATIPLKPKFVTVFSINHSIELASSKSLNSG